MPGRIEQLDVLRAGACMLVLIAHCNSVYAMPKLPVEAGAVGVAIFFALSGFLITRGMLSRLSSDGRIDLAGFYLKRATRILPIYMGLLLVLLPFWWDIRLAWCATFSFNFLYLSGVREYFHIQQLQSSVPPIGHLWSLCVEEHYYWCWPLVLAFLGRKSSAWLLLAVIIMTPVITIGVMDAIESRGANPDVVAGVVSRITWTQLTGLAIGSLVALHEQRLFCASRRTGGVPPVMWIGAALILVAWILGWSATQEQLLWMFDQNMQAVQALEPTRIHFWGAGIALVGMPMRWLAYFKSWQAIGRISYGLYLFHLPVYAWYGLATNSNSVSWLTAVMAVGTTFALAAVSFRYFEQPLIRWGQQQAGRRVPVAEASLRRDYRAIGWISSLGLFVLFAINMAAYSTTAPLSYLLNLSPAIPIEQRYHKIQPIGTAIHAYRWLGVDHCMIPEDFRRTTRIPPRRDGVQRIITVGDSYTWGACVHEQQTYSAILERELVRSGRNVEVINCGKPGGQAEDAASTIENQLIDHRPDIIIYAATMTDFLPSGQAWEGHTADEWYLRENEERFTQAVRAMQATCEQHNIKFIAFVFFQNPSDAKLASTARHIESLLHSTGVDTISIEEYLQANRDMDYRVFVPFDDHPNATCHRLIAQLLAKNF